MRIRIPRKKVRERFPIDKQIVEKITNELRNAVGHSFEMLC
jgi:hypothetical protein